MGRSVAEILAWRAADQTRRCDRVVSVRVGFGDGIIGTNGNWVLLWSWLGWIDEWDFDDYIYYRWMDGGVLLLSRMASDLRIYIYFVCIVWVIYMHMR